MHAPAVAERETLQPPGEAVGRLGDDHVARVCAGAQAGGDVQRSAAEAPVLERHRLAGIDADPDPERDLVVEVGLLVEPRLQVDGAPDRLARRREDGERLVASDLDDAAAVQLDVLGDDLDELVVRPAADSAPNSSVYRE